MGLELQWILPQARRLELQWVELLYLKHGGLGYNGA